MVSETINMPDADKRLRVVQWATGKVGRLGYWALDGLPPSASIFVTQTGEAISVSLLKTIAADPDAAPAQRRQRPARAGYPFPAGQSLLF